MREGAAKEISNSLFKFLKKSIKKAVKSEKTAAPSPGYNGDVSNTNDGRYHLPYAPNNRSMLLSLFHTL